MSQKNIVETLRFRSQKVEAMVPTTVRIPSLLEMELREFCAENNIALAVLVRECIARGWREVKTEAGFETAS